MVTAPNNRRLRVVIIVTAKTTATTFVQGFANNLAFNGCEVTIIADSIGRSSKTVGEGILTQIPVAMERDPHPLADLRSLVALTLLLRRIKPDVVTYATPKASLLSSVASAILRIPIRVYQLWGLRLETEAGVKRAVLEGLERLTSRLSTKVLANSPSLAERYSELKLNSGQWVEVLGQGSSHGVDLERFSQEADYPPLDEVTQTLLINKGDRLVIGFVGRLHPDKGIDTLVDAIRIVHRGGIPVCLILVGSNEGAEINLSGGLEPITVVVGPVSDPRPYYAAMDMLVLPSRREGFPNVVLEAAAMSVPSIVSDGTGVVDSVVDEETGIIVPLGRADSLAMEIRRLAENKELRESLGSAARRRVEQSFGQEDVWNKTQVYLTGRASRRT